MGECCSGLTEILVSGSPLSVDVSDSSGQRGDCRDSRYADGRDSAALFCRFCLVFFLPAVWILLAVTERMAKNPERLRRTGLILLTLGMITIVLNGLLFFAPDQTNLMTHNPQWYYRLRMLMQWW